MADPEEKKTSDRPDGDIADPTADFVRELAVASPPKSVEMIKAASAARDHAEKASRMERIRDRAYYLWIEAGRPDGGQDDFWLQAQSELYPDQKDRS